MHKKVDYFLAKEKRWQAEMTLLRSMVLACELTEDFKWKHPCYTWEEKP